MDTIIIEKKENTSEFDYLEQIYKKVKIGELVKFNGKVYMRVRPKNNKYCKNPYHFYLAVKDIYKGNVLSTDDDGEAVNTHCHYKIKLI